MKKEKEKLFRVLPLAVGLLLVGGNAMAVPVSAPVEYSVNQQTSQVTGVVNDANGDPLIGENVVEKGNTHNGAITDMDGKFVLNVSPNATLVFSYIGYKPVEVPVNGQRNITVTLHEDSEALDEVVVIGYGAVRKADLAGSVAVMDNKQFKDQPVTRIEDALQGRVSGISVTSSGVPGGDLKIRVRGASSINKSNDPLYVVDGIVRESGSVYSRCINFLCSGLVLICVWTEHNDKENDQDDPERRKHGGIYDLFHVQDDDFGSGTHRVTSLDWLPVIRRSAFLLSV